MSERQRIIAVGSSGSIFAQALRADPLVIPVETLEFTREREKRRLQVDTLDYRPVVVDDIAVSGLTLCMARQRITPEPKVAAVGMLYKSKTARRRSGFDDIRAGVVYGRFGGGNPPINSLATLQNVPERLDDLANRYFDDASEEFKVLVRRAQ